MGSVGEQQQQLNKQLCLAADAAHGLYNVTLIFAQMFMLILLSHLLHTLLKRIGQPSIVSHLLAGILMSDSGLGRTVYWKKYYDSKDVDHLTSMAALGRTLFMFVIGLEIDLPYLFRNFHCSAAITLGGILACGIASALSVFLHLPDLQIQGNRAVAFVAVWVLFANTASPVLIRMVTELKLGMSDVGRLAISSSLINDILCLLIVCAANLVQAGSNDATWRQKLAASLLGMWVILVSIFGMRALIRWMNERSGQRAAGISDGAVAFLILLVFAVSGLTEVLGYTGMMATFLLGATFPREGPSARTILRRLTYAINNLVLPVYFGFTGMQTNLFELVDDGMVGAVALIVLMGLLAKVAGTTAAARYLNMSIKEGVVLGLLINVKGHIDLIVISLGRKYELWDQDVYNALIMTVLINSVTAGPAAAMVVRRERKATSYRFMGLERLDPFSEVRLLTCVYSPHELPTMLDVIEISAGAEHSPASPYVMHLVEFTASVTTNMLYNQIQEEDQEMDLGGDNVRQVNSLVDTFIRETGVKLRALTTFSKYETMHRDLCNAAHDLRTVLVLLPFHRRLRFDGRMGTDHEGIRACNKNVLRLAPCTVGVLVDRGLGGLEMISTTTAAAGAAAGGGSNAAAAERGRRRGGGGGESSSNQTLHHVVVIFFGGPDDREAVAYGTRLAMHPCVSVTVVRFFLSSSTFRNSNRSGSGVYLREKNSSSEVLMDVTGNGGGGGDDDEVYMAQFHSRFVTSGMVTYAERLVENSAETVRALASMEGMYTLFVVGKERHGPTAKLTTGMSEWDECPELGSIGDLLASSDFMSTGSVLVIQQHRVNKAHNDARDLDEDEDEDEDDDDEEFRA